MLRTGLPPGSGCEDGVHSGEVARNPCTQEAGWGKRPAVSSRPVGTTDLVPEQPELGAKACLRDLLVSELTPGTAGMGRGELNFDMSYLDENW